MNEKTLLAIGLLMAILAVACGGEAPATFPGDASADGDTDGDGDADGDGDGDTDTDSDADTDTDGDTDTDTDGDTDTDTYDGDCEHPVCEIGEALTDGCSDCVTAVCEADDWCCGAGGGEWYYWCVDMVEDECGLDCGEDLAACTDLYTAGDIGGYGDCGESASTCTIAYNSTDNTCSEICEGAGGECIGAWNNTTACGINWGDEIGCDGDWYTTAICICSRGCGVGPACTGGETCVDGVCE